MMILMGLLFIDLSFDYTHIRVSSSHFERHFVALWLRL